MSKQTTTPIDDLEKAAEDLEQDLAKAAGKGPEKPAPTLDERIDGAREGLKKAAGQGDDLAKGDVGHDAKDANAGDAEDDAKEAAQGELVVSGKRRKVTASKEGAPEEHQGRVRGGGDGANKSAGAEVRDQVYQGLLESEEFHDAAPALEHLASVMGKGFEFAVDAIGTLVKAEIQRQLEPFAKALSVGLAADKALMKALGGFQARPTDAGVIGRVGDRVIQVGGRAGADAKPDARRADIQVALEKAIQDGKLEPEALELWHRWGDRYLTDRLPGEIAKSYGIPIPKTE